MTKSDNAPVLAMDLPLALVLLTRLPLPGLPQSAFARQARAAWAFPLVGLAVALPACGLGWAALAIGLPVGAAAGITLGLQILLTGAMHEDGLADTADGFWGGFTPARRLEIMKDSQIGTYGVLALILSLGLRWGALATLLGAGVFAPILAAAIWSRGLMPVIMTALPNARSDGLSSDVGRPGWATTSAAVTLALVAGLALSGPPAIAALVVSLAGVAAMALIARAKINGQTGDVLGASQQVAEILFLLTMTALI